MMTATAAAAGIRKRLLVFVLTAVARWQFERESQVKQNNANVFALCFCVPNIHQTIKYHCAMFNVQFVLKGTAKKKSQLEPCPPPTTIAQYKKKKKNNNRPMAFYRLGQSARHYSFTRLSHLIKHTTTTKTTTMLTL